MNNAPIQTEIEDLRSRINEWSDQYYLQDNPSVPDSVFDEAFRKLESLVSQHPELDTPDCPTKRVGPKKKSNLEKITHREKMLSLDNAFSNEELLEFTRRIASELGISSDKIELIGEPKIDGLALSLTYENGLLTQAATRGDGEEGEDVTHTAKVIRNIPLKLKTDNPPELLEVRGEAYMSKTSLEQYNEQAIHNGEKPLANCRNGVAGALRQLDPVKANKRRPLFMAYGTTTAHESQSQALAYLESIGFQVSDSELIVADTSSVEAHFDRISDKRSTMAMEIDGIVYKVNNEAAQEKLGYLSRTPRWAIARKFPAEEGQATLEKVSLQVGRTGAITPVAHLSPTQIGGVTVTRATLHNMDEIEALDVGIGDTVTIKRAGDVIPKVTSVVKKSDSPTPIVMKTHCPACGSEVRRDPDQSAYRCQGGLSCDAQATEAIKHFIGRDYMNIQGLGEKLIDQLFEERKLTSISEIFELQAADIESLPKQGKRSAEKVIEAIESAKSPRLDKFLAALGIREVGRSASKVLVEHFKSLEAIMNASKSELESLPDFGPIMAEYASQFFAQSVNQAEIQKMLELGVTPQAPKDSGGEEQPLSGQTWVITGTLHNMNRDQAKEKLESLGAKVSGSISGKTTALLAGENAGSKLEKAQKLGVRIADEHEVEAM